MKTAKKLFSLLLVAVLILSAIPFQASAAETFVVKFMDGTNVIGTVNVDSTGALQGSVPHAPAKAGYTWVGYDVRGTVMTVTPIQNMTFYADWFDNAGGEVRTLQVYAKYENSHPTCDFSTLLEDVVATCSSEGYKLYGCTGCDKTQKTNVVPATGTHSYTSTTTDPDCDTAGSVHYVCSVCGHDYSETGAAALGHDWQSVTVGNQTRKTCSVCGEEYTETNPDTVTFVNNHTTGNNGQMNYIDGEMITSVPTAAKIYGKKFLGWFANDGRQLIANQTIWDDDFAKTYYANYASSTDDGLSRVTVKCIYYVGTEAVATRDLYVVDLDDGTNIQTWLSNNYSKTNLAIQNNKPDSAQYNWEVIGKYYKLVNNTPVTTSDLIANGDVTIAVKAYADKSDIRNVYLYIHNKAGQKEVDIIQMTGFSVGSQVTVSNAQTAYKNKYNKIPTFANGVLYDEMAWSQLSQNQASAGSLSYTVSPDGLIVHAIVTGHTSAGTSKPASNPATGDMIETTAIVMVLAAAAVVTLTQLRKRKMI